MTSSAHLKALVCLGTLVALVALVLTAFIAHPALADVGACPVFPSDNVWNARVDALPVDSHSAAYVSAIGSGIKVHPDFGTVWDGGPIGIPYTTVPGTQPLVQIHYTAYGPESDPGPFPIPTDAPIEYGSDHHVLVVDRDHCMLYELYSAVPQVNGSWNADSGAKYDLHSNALRTNGWTSADAAGLPILAGLVRFDEVESGAINHALRFTAPCTANNYLWPARHKAPTGSCSNPPPLGQRFRLKSTFDDSSYPERVQVILKALQEYGMILADNGSSWYLSGAPDSRWNDDELVTWLGQVHGSDFEAVDESGLMVDPDSGQVSTNASTRTPTLVRTATSTWTPTSTRTPTLTRTPTRTSTPMRTSIWTRTPTSTPTNAGPPTPTPTEYFFWMPLLFR